MKELTDQLSAIGAGIEEEDQTVTLSLPPSYATIVMTALETQTDKLTLQFFQQALTDSGRSRVTRQTHWNDASVTQYTFEVQIVCFIYLASCCPLSTV